MTHLVATPGEPIAMPLTKGLSSLIDAIDVDLAGHRWCAMNIRGRYYVSRTIWRQGRNTPLYLHRVILERALGRPLRAGEETDHVNGDSLDNRRANLRAATHRQNSRNIHKHSDNTSGRKGVSWYQRYGCWRATIGVDGRTKHLGYYNTIDEAYAAYCLAAQQYFGEFARLDQPSLEGTHE